MKKSIDDLVCELKGISANLTLLRTQFEDGGRTLTDESMNEVLFSLQEHLDRITDEMQQ